MEPDRRQLVARHGKTGLPGCGGLVQELITTDTASCMSRRAPWPR